MLGFRKVISTSEGLCQSLALLKNICLNSKLNTPSFHAQPLVLVAFLWLMKALRNQVTTLKITNRFQTIKARAVGEQFRHQKKKTFGDLIEKKTKPEKRSGPSSTAKSTHAL